MPLHFYCDGADGKALLSLVLPDREVVVRFPSVDHPNDPAHDLAPVQKMRLGEVVPVGAYTCADLLRLIHRLGSSLPPGDPFLAWVWGVREMTVNGTRAEVVAGRLA